MARPPAVHRSLKRPGHQSYLQRSLADDALRFSLVGEVLDAVFEVAPITEPRGLAVFHLFVERSGSHRMKLLGSCDQTLPARLYVQGPMLVIDELADAVGVRPSYLSEKPVCEYCLQREADRNHSSPDIADGTISAYLCDECLDGGHGRAILTSKLRC